MNIGVRDISRPAEAAFRPVIADCDLHLGPDSTQELYPFMAKRWRDHIDMFGVSHRTGLHGGLPSYVKAQPKAARRDAFPPSGRGPGSDLDFTRTPHLAAYNVPLGLMNPPTPSKPAVNPELATALATPLPHYQVHCRG